MPAGAPTKYSEDVLKLAYDYVERWAEFGTVPQIARLALHCGISKTALYEWIKRPDRKELADVYARVKAMQEAALIDGGLTRDYDSSLSKLLLKKHGYDDKQEVNHTSSDGSMSPNKEMSAEDFAEKMKELGVEC